MIEHKIGRIVELGNKKYEVIQVLNSQCNHCDLQDKVYCNFHTCSGFYRKDKKSIIYKEVKNMKNEDPKEIKISIPEGYEIDEKKSTFEKIIFKKKEQEVKTWSDLVLQAKKVPEGSIYIGTNSNILEVGQGRYFRAGDQNIFTDEVHAKKALAISKINQLMPYYGGTITEEEWKDKEIPKYSLGRFNNRVTKVDNYLVYSFISFHTTKQRDSFYENNKQLVEDYLMIINND